MVCKMGRVSELYIALGPFLGLIQLELHVELVHRCHRNLSMRQQQLMITQIEAVKYDTNRKGCQLFLDISVFYLKVKSDFFLLFSSQFSCYIF